MTKFHRDRPGEKQRWSFDEWLLLGICAGSMWRTWVGDYALAMDLIQVSCLYAIYARLGGTA